MSNSKPTTALEEEVEAEAKRIVETQFTQCGDSHYAEVTIGVSTPNIVIAQCRSLSFESSSINLSEADKLNGIEWKGTVSSKPVAERFYARSKWSDWEPPLMNAVCKIPFEGEKKNSVWTLKGGFTNKICSGYSCKYRKISCSDVPK
jgi:hypothetical protein